MATARFAPDFMIMQRRKEEENRRIYDEKTKSNSAYERVAVWEHKTGKTIERGQVTRKVQSMKRDLEQDLEARRARLAALLVEEDAQYTVELEQLEETPELRRDRLKARARELVRRREQEKREFAKEMKERQFRETCDQFREYDGVYLLRECVADCDKAMVERGEEKKRSKEEAAMWHNRYPPPPPLPGRLVCGARRTHPPCGVTPHEISPATRDLLSIAHATRPRTPFERRPDFHASASAGYWTRCGKRRDAKRATRTARSSSAPRCSEHSRSRLLPPPIFLSLFFTLVTGHRRSLSLKLSDARVNEPQIRARLGNHNTPILGFCRSSTHGDTHTCKPQFDDTGTEDALPPSSVWRAGGLGGSSGPRIRVKDLAVRVEGLLLHGVCFRFSVRRFRDQGFSVARRSGVDVLAGCAEVDILRSWYEPVDFGFGCALG